MPIANNLMTMETAVIITMFGTVINTTLITALLAWVIFQIIPRKTKQVRKSAPKVQKFISPLKPSPKKVVKKQEKPKAEKDLYDFSELED